MRVFSSAILLVQENLNLIATRGCGPAREIRMAPIQFHCMFSAPSKYTRQLDCSYSVSILVVDYLKLDLSCADILQLDFLLDGQQLLALSLIFE